MDVQTVLQHVFGFIGICTVAYWFRKLFFWYLNREPVSNKDTCMNCGCKHLSRLRSINIKKCTSCAHEMPWNLEPGQESLIQNNRKVKRK